jgi:hypothetical protein
MHSPNNLGISATDYKYMVIGMQNLSADNTAQLYWITDANSGYDGTKAIGFSIVPNDTKIRYYVIDLSANANWKGVIKQIRFDPVGTVSSGAVKIDFIKFVGTKPSTISVIPGTIEIEDFNLGGQGNAYSDADATNNGGKYRTSEAVDIETCAEGGYDVGWTAAGEWMEYLVNVSKAGSYAMTARIASATDGNQFRIDLGGQDITGLVTINNSGQGLQTYANYTSNVTLTVGLNVLRLYVSKANGGFNLNKLTFVQNVTTGISTSEESNTSFIAYPNPANDVLTIQVNDLDLGKQLSLMNTAGIEVLNHKIDKASSMISLSNLSAGVYVLKLGEKVQKVIISK